MRTKLTVATALAGTLLATGLISASAQATSLPVLKGDAPPGVVTLVGHGGGGVTAAAAVTAAEMVAILLHAAAADMVTIMAG